MKNTITIENIIYNRKEDKWIMQYFNRFEIGGIWGQLVITKSQANQVIEHCDLNGVYEGEEDIVCYSKENNPSSQNTYTIEINNINPKDTPPVVLGSSGEDRMLNEAEILSIKRLNSKKVSLQDISDRIGISVDRVKEICKK